MSNAHAQMIGGPRNIIPGTIMFTLFGYAGQMLYNALDRRHTQQIHQSATDKDSSSLWRRLANSKYSPMKILSDEEYEKILKGKLLRVEAEIAVIDDDIDKLKIVNSQEREGSSQDER